MTQERTTRADAAAGDRFAVLRSVGLKVVSTGLFAVMGALIKWLGPDYPTGQIVFVRSLFALIPVLLLVRAAGGWSVLRTARPWSHLGRSLAGVTAMFCRFTSLTLIPLATATAITFAAPLITTALAAWLLGETVRRYRWTAVTVGFLGVLLMLQPAVVRGLTAGAMDDAYVFGAAAALLGAVFMAIAMIQIRHMTATEPGISIVFYFSATCTVVGAATLPFAAVMPDLLDGAAMVAIGVVGGLAQVTLTASYRNAGASLIAPFEYTALLWAFLIGYVVFGEVPEPVVLAGAAVVVAAGVFILHREHRLGLERARQRRPEPPL